MSLRSQVYPAAETRLAARSSLYLGATLYRDGLPMSVRIRNLSSGGALVEAGVVPKVGAHVQLTRGYLVVDGLIVWSDEARCGIKFLATVDVQVWRSIATNRDQERVDDVISLFKAGEAPLSVEAPNGVEGDVKTDHVDHTAADLRRVAELLAHLGEVLAADPDVVARHGISLQNLDISSQMIAALQLSFIGRRSERADERRVGLRRSADQVLKRA